jgi:hypothetical protein
MTLTLEEFLRFLAENDGTLEFSTLHDPLERTMKVTMPAVGGGRVEWTRRLSPYAIGDQLGWLLGDLARDIIAKAACERLPIRYMPARPGTNSDFADGTRRARPLGGTLHNASPRSDP